MFLNILAGFFVVIAVACLGLFAFVVDIFFLGMAMIAAAIAILANRIAQEDF